MLAVYKKEIENTLVAVKQLRGSQKVTSAKQKFLATSRVGKNPGKLEREEID